MINMTQTYQGVIAQIKTKDLKMEKMKDLKMEKTKVNGTLFFVC